MQVAAKYGLPLLAIVLGMSACSDDNTSPHPASSDLLTRTMTGTVEGAWGTIQAPFEDIGLKEDPIPPALLQLAGNPYSLPFPTNCPRIEQELATLDAILGPDYCTPQNPYGTPSASKTYLDQGAHMAQDKAVGLVQSKVVVLPFRGVIRRVSGAEKHSREVAQAYQTGKLRRAYLRGLGSLLGCACDSHGL